MTFMSAEVCWPDLVAVKGADILSLFKRGMQATGGMDRFITKGADVVVKPCMLWNAPPENAANTAPQLAASIVEECFTAGARRVSVFDRCVDRQRLVYNMSGIASAVKKAGADICGADRQADYSPGPGGFMIHKRLLECDHIINVPVLKHDPATAVFAAMQNLLGTVYDRDSLYKNGIGRSIAELSLYIRPVLNIIDAYNVITAGHVRGGDGCSYKELRTLLLSENITAADYCAALLLGIEPENVSYLNEAGWSNEFTIQRITL